MNFSEFMSIANRTQESLYVGFSNDVLFYSIALAAIMGKLKESSKSNVLSAWVMYFMGTLFHELAHFTVSLITYGKPFWFSVIPSTGIDKATGRKIITLGHVKSANIRWWNTFFVSMAPLLLLPLSYWVYNNFFTYIEVGLWSSVFYIFTIVSLLFSAIPSSVDFENVFNSNAPTNLFFPIVIGMLYFIFWDNLPTGGLF
ncbi:MAG: hypothetical protein PHS42_04610 [Sulfurimonas sp.]|nr:hypothetical protein [Sulfurimonas sp.]